jgi:hypothetical protein
MRLLTGGEGALLLDDDPRLTRPRVTSSMGSVA